MHAMSNTKEVLSASRIRVCQGFSAELQAEKCTMMQVWDISFSLRASWLLTQRGNLAKQLACDLFSLEKD